LLTHHSRGLGCQQIANLLVKMMMHHHVQEKVGDFTHPSFLPLMCLMCI
jgi:hypothetical protein